MADEREDLIVWRCTGCAAVAIRFERDGRPRSRCAQTHDAGWPVRWQAACRIQTLPFIPRSTPRAAPTRTGEQLALAVVT